MDQKHSYYLNEITIIGIQAPAGVGVPPWAGEGHRPDQATDRSDGEPFPDLYRSKLAESQSKTPRAKKTLHIGKF